VTVTNTPACESLPSQISNFTSQFFGIVTKTEVNGQVRWVLPCNLETGLPNNPRSSGEGLACYFLRLFDEGITGATGPAGPAGTAGTNGHNAYTVTLQGFTQPTLGAPNVVLRTSYNPSIITGTYIFVQGSGWYLVTNTDFSGNVWATLQRALSGVSGTVGAGRLVVPSGFPGESIVGPTGPQGIAGPQGTPGVSYTAQNGQTNYPAGTNYALQVAYAAVNFVAGNPQVLLPALGTYKITCTVAFLAQAGVGLADVVAVKLYNVSNSADVAASEQSINRLVDTQRGQLVIEVIYTTDGINKTVALYGSCTTAGAVNLVAARTVINYVRLA
jgi:hypothetical protein